MTAKNDILSKIRPATVHALGMCEAEYAAIPRAYRQSATLDSSSRIRLFAERLQEYEATVHRCAESQIQETVARALAARRKRTLLVPPGMPSEWLPSSVAFLRDEGLTFDEIDQSEGVMTGCAIAIAVTGTIVLRHSPGEGRRALTLIPDYHLCVVFTKQVVESVPEGIREMAKFGNSPMTTISGPSATSDIEMTRVKGVHGPRTLDVILVGE